MATENIGFNVTVGGVEKSIKNFKDLKQATKDLTDEQLNMSLKFGDSSEQATKAGKKLAELKDKVEDLNKSSKNVSDSGFKILKGGVDQVKEGLMNLDFGKVKSGITSMASGFLAMGRSAVAALTTVKGAIAATGIGLLVIALGVIYSYWDDIKGIVDGVTPEMKKQNQLANENLKIQQEKYDSLLLSENSLKVQGKTEREILQLKIAQTNEEIKAAQIALVRTIFTTRAQTEAAQRNKDILQGLINLVSAPITALLKGIDSIGSAFGKDFGLADKFKKSSIISTYFFDAKQVKDDGDKLVKESQLLLDKLVSQRDGFKNSVNELNKQQAAGSKKANDDAAKLALELQNKLLELQAQLIKSEEEKEQKILRNKYLADQKDLYNKGANAELLKTLNLVYEQDKLGITDKYIKLRQEKEKEDNDKFESAQKEKIANYLSRLESEYQLESQRLTNEGKNLQAGSQAEEENNAKKVELKRAHFAELYNINIANAKLLGLDVTNIENKNQQDKEAAEDAARERKKAKEKQLQKDIFDSVVIAAQTSLAVSKTLSDTYYMKESQKNNKLYADKLKNVRQGSKEEKAILDQKAKDEKDLARQQFETQKKFNRASAIINGLVGIGALFMVPDPTFGILTAVRVAALVATTAANVAQINSTAFDEGGSSAGGIPAAETSAPTTSQAPAIYGPGQGQSTTFTGNQNNNFAPVKAYVVETENRSTTNRVNKLVSESTYG